MADSILRLRVDSAEYDNKLKQATNGLTRYVDECRKVGGTLEVVEKETLDYVRALGQMDTTSRTATGKLAEMKKTFTELSAQYKQMTDAEKNSPFGKALDQSLDQLKTRINDSKAQLNDVNKELNGSGGLKDALDQVAGKFGLNIGQLTKFGGVLAVTTGALSVAKDAFFANEENLDEWGRTVESAESLYKGFLNALNTGDISGYLSNIGNIVSAARDAYDAMDELATFNAFNRVNLQRARTGLSESIASYREGTGSKEDVKKAGEAYKKELADRKKYEIETYKATVREIAQQRGVDSGALMSALSGSYGSYKFIKGVMPSGKSASFVGTGFGGGGTFAEGTVTKTRLEELGRALREFNDKELDQLQMLREKAYQTGEEIAGIDKQVARVMNGRQGGSAGSSGSIRGSGRGAQNDNAAAGSIAAQEKLVGELTKKWKEAGEAVRDGYYTQLSYAKQQLAEMTGGFNPNKLNQIASTSVNFTAGTAPIAPDKIEFSEGLQKQMDSITQGGNNAAKSWNLAAQAVSNVGTAFSNIEDPGVKAVGTVMQAIASIALGFAMASSNANTAGTGWGWLAWLAAGTAAMATTISTIHSLTGYAEGGIVKGNSYSGDNIYAGNGTMVNAGELILNRSQQLAVASQLQQSNPLGNSRLVARLKGADLLLSIERELAVTGKGELATFR